MKNLSFFHIPIRYLLLYVLALLGTGIWLFLLSQGLESSGSLPGTLQKILHSPEAKSLHNFVEVATPHLFAMGVMVFVVAHFMLFSTKISQKNSLIVSMILFVLMFGNIFAYLLITFSIVSTGLMKLVSLGLFVVMFLVLLGMVAVSL